MPKSEQKLALKKEGTVRMRLFYTKYIFLIFHISVIYNWLNIFMDRLFPGRLPTAARDLCVLKERQLNIITIGK